MPKRVRKGDEKVAIAYLRASTGEQKLSPEAQRAAVEAWASAHGVTVAAWHVDQGVSGAAGLDERPALACAFEDLRQRGAGVLVAAKRDRLARDPYLTCAIERAVAGLGAQVVSADGNGNGDDAGQVFMKRILDGAAEYELALIRSRTKAALAAKKARGERIGGHLPYGWRLAEDGVRLVPDAPEQALLRRIRDLTSAGLSQRAVARQLAADGHRSRSGLTLTQSQVQRLLRTPLLPETSEAAA